MSLRFSNYVVLLAVGLLSAGGTYRAMDTEDVLNPGNITPEEAAQLHDSDALVTLGTNSVADDLDELFELLTSGHAHLGKAMEMLTAVRADARATADAQAANVALAQQLYLYDTVEVDPPIDPPIDPPPPVFDGYGPDPDVVLTEWLWRPIDGAGRKDIPALPDKWLPGTADSPSVLEGFKVHVASKGDSGGNVVSGNFNDYDDFMILRNGESYWANKWFHRQYGTRRDVIYENMYWHDGVQEHVIYHNMVGWAKHPEWGDPMLGLALMVRNSYAYNIPGQFIQIVQRPGAPHETKDPSSDFALGGWIVVEDTKLERVGIWDESERASFALSFFATDNPVRVSRVVLDNSTLVDHSRGALLCQGGITSSTSRPMFVMEDCDFTVGTLKQPFLKFEDMDGEIIIRDCDFDALGGQDYLDFEECDGPITVSGCTGDTVIRKSWDVNGDGKIDKNKEVFTIGPITEGYSQ